jgi:hypothetical protein
VAAAWLLLSAWRAPADLRRRIAIGVVLACVAAGALVLLLYLPIIRTAGLGALAGNRFVQPSTWPVFATELPRHIVETLLAWTSPLPWWGGLIVVALALIGIARPIRSERPSLALATALWCGVVLAATHRVPFVRVWLWMLPLFLLAVARGLARCLEPLRAALPSAERQAAVGLALVTVGIALASHAVPLSGDTGAFPAARDVTARLAGELRAGDRVLAPIPTNGPLLYYFSAAGLDTALLNTPPAATRRAFLVLQPERGRTLQWAVSIGMIAPADYREPVLLLQRRDVEVWRSERR